jgi:hypothetical protein
MSKHEQDVPSAPDVPVAGHELWQRRLQDRYAAKAAQGHAPLSTSDADKYRWIRANRGNYAIVNALNDSPTSMRRSRRRCACRWRGGTTTADSQAKAWI